MSLIITQPLPLPFDVLQFYYSNNNNYDDKDDNDDNDNE